MKIEYKKVESVNEFIDAISIRVKVFVIEQKTPPGWEPDEFDKASHHYIALVDNKIAATARLREIPKNVVKIERMSVKSDYRGNTVGLGLTKYIVDQAIKQGYKKIWMQAQEHAKEFYEKAGFITVSAPYDLHNLGISHVDMEYLV